MNRFTICNQEQAGLKLVTEMVIARLSYLFVSYMFTQFKVMEKVFGIRILFTGSEVLLARIEPATIYAVGSVALLYRASTPIEI